VLQMLTILPSSARCVIQVHWSTLEPQQAAHLCIGNDAQRGGKLLLCEAFALSGRSTFGCAPDTRQVVLREPRASKELHRLAARDPAMGFR
jgi:hypothetical protein